jgi:hypothetical protein
MDASRSMRSEKARADILEALHYAELTGLLRNRVEPKTRKASTIGKHHLITDAHPSEEACWTRTYDARKENWRHIALAVPAASVLPEPLSATLLSRGIQDGSAFRMDIEPAVAISIHDVYMVLYRIPLNTSQPKSTPSSVEQIIKDAGFNAEQARAFSIVATHSQGEPKKPL